MLEVKTPIEVADIIKNHFAANSMKAESIKTVNALGRILHHNILSREFVPGFNRSTVDGYAVIASDTFGCSESIPAVLTIIGEVLMGESAEIMIELGTCVIVSTGGELPDGADAVVMVEHTEDYGSGLLGIQKPAAPGNNVIFKGDDVSVGDKVLTAGIELKPHDIGILSALGYSEINVSQKPVVGVISTGNELIATSDIPHNGMVRNVNTPLLLTASIQFGAVAEDFGIIQDDENKIRNAVLKAVESCDIVLISGGSSAGARDLTARVIETEGKLLFHGIAMKPGKPTILGIINEKPIFGLPGHPVAAYLIAELFVRPLISQYMGAKLKRQTTGAFIGETISSNHGREEYIAVRLENEVAHPIKGKSGLIASLAGVDGYICVPRNCEGLSKGTAIEVTYF